MIARWMNTNVSTAAEMLEVTDEMILEMSNGEVLHPAPLEEDDPYKNSMTDSSIFGKMNEDKSWMGHIELPVPIVNIQYLFGTRPILPRLLKIPRHDLESVVYCSSFIVTEPGDSDASYKQVVSVEDVPGFQEETPEAVLSTGAEAVAALLEKDGIEEKDYIILHRLPVIPISLRYKKENMNKQNEAWIPFSIEYLYDHLVIGKNRFTALTDLNAPQEILLNEKRLLQEAVDTLVNNGVRGLPFVSPFGIPSESLQEVYEITSLMSGNMRKPSMPSYEPVDLEVFAKQMQIISPLTEDEEVEGIWDAPYIPETDPQAIAEKEIQELLHPFVDAVIRHNFPEYVTDYYDVMCLFAEWSISNGLGKLNLEKPIEPQLLEGIVKTVRIAMKKQAMYL